MSLPRILPFTPRRVPPATLTNVAPEAQLDPVLRKVFNDLLDAQLVDLANGDAIRTSMVELVADMRALGLTVTGTEGVELLGDIHADRREAIELCRRLFARVEFLVPVESLPAALEDLFGKEEAARLIAEGQEKLDAGTRPDWPA